MIGSGLQRRFLRFGAFVLAGSLFFTACGGGGDDDSGGRGNEGESASDDEATETTARDCGELPAGGSWTLHVRNTIDDVPIYANDGDEEPAQLIPNPHPTYGVGVVFLVDGGPEVDPCNDEYLPVWLPVPPEEGPRNQGKGWVRSEDMIPSPNTWSVKIELEAHRLTVLNEGQPAFETSAGLGRATRATPVGTYFIRENIKSSLPAYGPYALGITGFSDDPAIIDEFGPTASVGIHGTNDPSSIGANVSSGCIRIDNEVITRMATDLNLDGQPDNDGDGTPEDGLPLGTPVIIVP